MSRRIICTVGTSLLTNGERPWDGWRRGMPLPPFEEMVQWVGTADPETATAETNSLRALEIDETDRLDLLHSATEEGRLCARVLRQQYAPRVREATVHEIGQLGYGVGAFTTGLKGLVNLAIQLIRKAREQWEEPVLCATGGFKAEIALLNLLGALLEVEVVYIHEQFRSLVRLPRLPLSWDDEFVTKHEPFFRWIDEEPRLSSEVESWLRGNPELRAVVEDDGEGHTLLSAAGDLLFKAAQARRASGPRASWPEADARPPEEKNRVSQTPHHRPDGWVRFVERLCRIDCVSSVRYEEAASTGPRVRVLDPARGAIAMRYEAGGNALPLRVETTARNQAQCELVANHLVHLR